MKPIFIKAIPVLEILEDAGFEAYFVGGSVRDFILGKEIDDVDIATSATPKEVKGLFQETIDVGIEHGTVMVIYGKQTYEVTTFRSESEYIDFRRPSEVSFIRSLEEDLKRRDFTMNSIAMTREGTIIDPFRGIEDIEQKRIVTVGNASERFHEDALRMMRAVRFVSQLSFNIEKSTFQALQENASLLEKIAIERKTIEFEKLLKGENRNSSLRLLVESNLFKYLPGLDQHAEAINMAANLKTETLSVDEMWAVLLHLMNIQSEEIEPFLRTWKLAVKKIREIKSILEWLNFRLESDWTSEALYKAQLNISISVEKLCGVIHNRINNELISQTIERYENLIIKDLKDLAVTGNDLLGWSNKKGGPWIKQQLSLIEKAVLVGDVKNQKEEIREWLLKCNQT
jgi:tRNA nucleotidyltransferase (CCA-adding enzyme)